MTRIILPEKRHYQRLGFRKFATVKINTLEMLARPLRIKQGGGILIPRNKQNQPSMYGLTRRSYCTLEEHDCPLTVQLKSDLVQRPFANVCVWLKFAITLLLLTSRTVS